MELETVPRKEPRWAPQTESQRDLCLAPQKALHLESRWASQTAKPKEPQKVAR